MTGLRIALFEDVLTPGTALCLPGGAVRIHWLRHGAAAVNGAALAADTAAASEGETVIEGEGALWTFALSRGPVGYVPAERRRLVLAAPIARDPAVPLLFRLDRVDFPPDGETPRHGHSGPGLRRLLSGRLLMEIGPRLHRADPGQAWFEPGDEPVVARPLAPGSAFLRAMVLDPALLGGQSSFVPWTPAEAAKPRNAAYRLYAESVATLG